jgi:hypothetical protein
MEIFVNALSERKTGWMTVSHGAPLRRGRMTAESNKV